MALIGCKEPVYDRQVNRIFEMIENGITKEEIAKELGYKNPVSVDNYMRRRNFSWDSKTKNFVSAAERYSAKSSNKQVQLHGISKTDYVTAMFEQGEFDAKEIAQRTGFDTHKELATFMKNKGFAWNAEDGNYGKNGGSYAKNDGMNNNNDGSYISSDGSYISNDGSYISNDGTIQKSGISENPDKEERSIKEILNSVLPLLKNIKQEGIQNSQINSISKNDLNNMPRYLVKGMYCSKAMRMANVINELVCSYSEERNISQREIVEVALIDFFKKYGYQEKVQDFIHR